MAMQSHGYLSAVFARSFGPNTKLGLPSLWSTIRYFRMHLDRLGRVVPNSLAFNS